MEAEKKTYEQAHNFTMRLKEKSYLHMVYNTSAEDNAYVYLYAQCCSFGPRIQNRLLETMKYIQFYSEILRSYTG